MSFRIVRTKDEELIKKLHERTFPVDEYYSNRGNVFWVVREVETGSICGFCIGTDIGHGIFYFSRVGVLKPFRGKGLHKRMIKTRERYAKKNGFRVIITFTIKENPHSFVHLVKTGYEMYSPEHPWVGEDVLYFRKVLSE